MPDKEVIERLRGIIKELEARATSSAGFPFGGPDTGAAVGGSERPARSELSGLEARAGDTLPESGVGVVPSGTGSPPASSRVSDVPALRTDTRVEQGYSVITTVYAEAATPELLPPPPGSLPGFRSLEPCLDTMENWVYLDIETTGLLGAATIAFLVGVGEWTNEGFAIDQYFLTERQHEDAMLADLSRTLSGRTVLITFNGKAFDVPVLRSRYVMVGARPSVPLRAHLDYLSLTRNMGRRTSFGQSLKEAVRRFTGIVRDGDIPGHMIPALYFIYEREGDPSVLFPVLKHNRLDVLDMACLTWVFGHILMASARAGDPESLAGAGKLHLRRGNLDLAKRCLETAQAAPEFGRISAESEAIRLRLLGQVMRKRSEWEGAVAVLEALVSTGLAKDEDYLSLARCYELGACDLEKAIETVDRALAKHVVAIEEAPECLLRRKRRLERIVARRASTGAERRAGTR